MTTLKPRLLAHLCHMATMDKNYAWWAAKRYAEMMPDWADLPELLTQAMRKLQG